MIEKWIEWILYIQLEWQFPSTLNMKIIDKNMGKDVTTAFL